jgi:hypothetical protein
VLLFSELVKLIAGTSGVLVLVPATVPAGGSGDEAGRAGDAGDAGEGVWRSFIALTQ